MGTRTNVYRIAALAMLAIVGPASSQSYLPAPHTMAAPLFSGATPVESQAYANAGVQIE